MLKCHLHNKLQARWSNEERVGRRHVRFPPTVLFDWVRCCATQILNCRDFAGRAAPEIKPFVALVEASQAKTRAAKIKVTAPIDVTLSTVVTVAIGVSC